MQSAIPPQVCPQVLRLHVHYEDGTRDREGDEPQFDPGVLTEGDTTYLFTGFCGHGDKSRHVQCSLFLIKVYTPLEGTQDCCTRSSVFRRNRLRRTCFLRSIIHKKTRRYLLLHLFIPCTRTFAMLLPGIEVICIRRCYRSNNDMHIDSCKTCRAGCGIWLETITEVWSRSVMTGISSIIVTLTEHGSQDRDVLRSFHLPKTDISFRQEMTSCGLNGGPLSRYR